MRSPRLDPEHGIHHVYSRGTRRWLMFLDDHDRRQFLRRLATVCDRYGILVLAYCLMDNHYHLILYCPDKHLSEMQRDLKSMHARLYNDRHNFSGPVFEGRFNSKPVVNAHNLKRLTRYVHRNAYAIDPAMRLGDYAWSSPAIFLGERPCPAWLKPNEGLALFGDGSTYKAEVETPVDGDEVQNVVDLNAVPASPASGRAAWDSLGLDEVLIAVARAAGTGLDQVHPSRRNGLVGLALIIAIDIACYTPDEVAEAFGYRAASAVRSAVRRSRGRLSKDHTLASTFIQAREHLGIMAWT